MNSEKLFMRINAKKSFENYSQFSYLCQVRFSLNPFSNMQIKTSIFCKNLLLEYNHQGMTSQILDGTKKMDFTYDYSGSRNTMKYYEGSTLKRSKIYCGMYEKETDSYGTKEICYVSTPSGITAFHLKTNGGSSVFYQHLDHQGSPLVLSDQGGNKINEQSFDAWGRRRNPNDYSYSNISLSSIPLRGYTGHEMIDEFTLINMNGRIYDPQLCRFLAPDRFVQAPGNSQSFNRYSYCLNNPLKYVDPSGERFLGSLITMKLDFYKTIFTKGGLDPTLIFGTSSQKAEWRDSWSDFDPTKTGTKTNNAIKIDLGKFEYDKHYSGKGDVWRDAWQVISRFTPRETLPTTWGNAYAHCLNISGEVESVNYFYGATVLDVKEFTLDDGVNGRNIGGAYIVVRNYEGIIYDEAMNLSTASQTLIHEYGHYQQCAKYGTIAYIRGGINSAKHPRRSDDNAWFERDASNQGAEYFSKYYNMDLNYEVFDDQGLEYLQYDSFYSTALLVSLIR